MPLLMMIPARLSSPRITMKPNGACMRSRPGTTPMNVSGIVNRMMSGRRKELNCQTNSARIRPKHTGMLATSRSIAVI